LSQDINKGVKFDSGKNRLDLIPMYPLWELGRIYTFGATKYADDNWRKGISFRRVFAAVLRHLFKWWAGEQFDPESGLPHLGHATWGLMTLMEYEQVHPEFDDRPKEVAKIPQ
jgi:Domain of unknown function (DUF5664)